MWCGGARASECGSAHGVSICFLSCTFFFSRPRPQSVIWHHLHNDDEIRVVERSMASGTMRTSAQGVSTARRPLVDYDTAKVCARRVTRYVCRTFEPSGLTHATQSSMLPTNGASHRAFETPSEFDPVQKYADFAQLYPAVARCLS